MIVWLSVELGDFVIGAVIDWGVAQYLQERLIETLSDLVHAGLPAGEGLGGDLEGDPGFALGKVVEEGVGAIDHHEVGAGTETGVEEFREVGIPDSGFFSRASN